MLPLLKATVRDLYAQAYDAVTLGHIQGNNHYDLYDSATFCSSFLAVAPTFKSSIILKLANLYDKSDDTSGLEESLFELVASTYRMSDSNVISTLNDFIRSLDSEYSYDDCGIDSTSTYVQLNDVDCCGEMYKAANFSDNAIAFSYAVAFSLSRYIDNKEQDPSISLGSLLTRSLSAERVILAVENKIEKLNKIITTLRSYFSDIVGNTSIMHANDTLSYLANSTKLNIDKPVWTKCNFFFLEKGNLSSSAQLILHGHVVLNLRCPKTWILH